MSQIKLGDLFGWTPEQTEQHEQQVTRVKGLASQLRERLAGLSTELGCEPEEVLKLLQRRLERRKGVEHGQ